MASHDREFSDFVAGSQRRLVHFADLLTGDHARAEDLVQDALVKAYAAWPRIKPGAAESYVRRCILNGRTDWWRRRSSRERPIADHVEQTAPADRDAELDRRLVVLASLARLTTRERTVIAMRYYLELSEAEIATELGIAPGTVKSAAARAIAKLRTDPVLSEGVTS